MYIMNEKNRRGERYLPFTDEAELHPEDVKPDWYFIPSIYPLRKDLHAGSYSLKSYLHALRSKSITKLYNRGMLYLESFRSPLFARDRIYSRAMKINPDHVIGTIQAVTGDGIYIQLRNPPFFNKELFHMLADSMEVRIYTRSHFWKPGISRIDGWSLDYNFWPDQHRKLNKEE